MLRSAWQQLPECRLLFGTIRSCAVIVLLSVAALLVRAFIAPLFHSSTPDFTHFTVFVWRVQHLGIALACPNFDEAFHLLAAPSEPVTHSAVVVVVVVTLSHNAQPGQHT